MPWILERKTGSCAEKFKKKLVEGRWTVACWSLKAPTSKQPHPRLPYITTYVNPHHRPTRLRSELAHETERTAMSSNPESEVDKVSEVTLCLFCHETTTYIISRSVTSDLPNFKLCLSRSFLRRVARVALRQVKGPKLQYLKIRVIQPQIRLAGYWTSHHQKGQLPPRPQIPALPRSHHRDL